MMKTQHRYDNKPTLQYALTGFSVVLATVLTGCGTTESSSALPIADDQAEPPHQLKWFTTEISAPIENAAYDVPVLNLSYTDQAITVASNGIPSFEYVPTTPNALKVQQFEFVIPRNPVEAEQPQLIPLLGTVAFTTTGLPIFGPNEAQHPHPFGDPAVQEILDYCHGHTGGQGEYHFHAAPECLITHPDGVEEHYNIIGFALDGYPIIAHYRSLLDDQDNVVLDAESNTQFDWLEISGYQPDQQYGDEVINGNQDSTFTWPHYGVNFDYNHDGKIQNSAVFLEEAMADSGYNVNRINADAELATLDQCNGRILSTEKKIPTESGLLSEQDFFNFEYAYFIAEEFPYFIAMYHGEVDLL